MLEFQQFEAFHLVLMYHSKNYTMKKIKFHLATLMVVAFISHSCSDDFFEINEDPNGPTRTTAENQLPNIIQETMHLQDVATTGATAATSHLANTSAGSLRLIDDYGPSGFAASLFQNNYFWVGINNEKMIEWAEEEGADHYVGVGKILKAINFAYTVDGHGDVYFRDAFDPSVILHEFDDGEFVYGELLRLLEEGIQDLQGTSTIPLAEGDILFNGDIQKWIGLANAERARLLNHTTKKSSYDPNAVLQAVDNAFSDVSGEAVFQFSGEPLSDRTSSATGGFGFVTATGLKRWDKVYIDYLKGIGTGGVEDPRLPLIAVPGEDGEFRGVVDGITLDGLDPALVGTVVGGFYSSPASPFFIFSYEELKFIEAEAAFLTGNTTRAFDAYQSAVTTNMERMGLDAATIQDYFDNNPVAASSSADITLAKIMFQKYLTLPFHPEVWVDMRRYDYSDDIYPGFSQPANADPALGGQFIRRLDMFNAEIQFNAEEAARVGALDPDYRAKPVWWDTTN